MTLATTSLRTELTDLARLRLALSLALCLLLLGCDKQVRIRVRGGPAGRSAHLVVQPYIQGQPTLKRERFDGQPEQFWLHFSADTHGEVAVYGESLDGEGAVVARGEARAQLAADGVTELTLTLATLSTPLHGCVSGVWCVESPAAAPQSLFAITGLGNRLWAVGTQGTLLYSADAGATWATQPSGTHETLRGVWGRPVGSELSLWAIGTHGTILRHQGGVWQDGIVPPQDATYHALRKHDWQGIWGADPEDFWIVGDYSAAAHYERGRWTFLPAAQTTRDETLGLYSVWGTGTGSLWAVGGRHSIDGAPHCQNYTRVVLSGDGKKWTRLSDPAAAAEQYPLRQITGAVGKAAGPIWLAGGYQDCGGAPRAAVWQLTPSLQPHAMPPQTAAVLGLWADPDGSVWLVGGDARTGQPAAYQRPAGATQFVALALPAGHPGVLRAITGTESHVIAVGDLGNILRFDKRAVVAHKDPAVQAASAPRLAGDITAMWAASADDVWAVGADAATDSGFVMRWNGQSWQDLPFRDMAPLYGVRGSSPNRVWLIGGSARAGTSSLWLWNGSRLLNCPLPSYVKVPLLGVWTLPPAEPVIDTGCDSAVDDLWIAGGQEPGVGSWKPGLFLNKRGMHWPAGPPPLLAGNIWVLYSVWGSDSGHTWIVGGRNGGVWGPVVIACDSDCREEQQPAFPDSWPWLFSVWGTDRDNIYVAAGNITLPKGNVFRRSLDGWGIGNNQTPTALPTDGLFGLAGTGPTDVYAVGGTVAPNRILDGGMQGFIQHRNFAGWKTEPMVTTHSLRSITSAGLGSVWIGGSGRTILRERLPAPAK